MIRPTLPLLLLIGSAACAVGPSGRSLHVVDGEVVHSPPVAPSAYAAYMRARLNLESDAPDYARALADIDVALRMSPRDAHLWTTRGEIHQGMGETAAARADLQRALTLQPDYSPARELLTTLGRPDQAGG